MSGDETGNDDVSGQALIEATGEQGGREAALRDLALSALAAPALATLTIAALLESPILILCAAVLGAGALTLFERLLAARDREGRRLPAPMLVSAYLVAGATGIAAVVGPLSILSDNACLRLLGCS